MKALGCFFYSILLILTITFSFANSASADLTSNLGLHMPMNGNIDDVSGNLNIATYGTGTYTPAENHTGANGTALGIVTPGGTRDAISIPVNSSLQMDNQPLSISFKMWLALNSTNNSWLIQFSSTDGGYYLYHDYDDQRIVFALKGEYDYSSYKRTKTIFYQTSNDTAPLGQWIHVFIEADRSTATGVKIYLNNVLEKTGDATSIDYPIISESDMTVAASVDGIMDDFRIYHRLLTTAERTELYNLTQEHYIDFVDTATDLIDTDNSGSDEIALLKKTTQGIAVHLKDQDSASTPTDETITGFFNSSLDWKPISVSIMTDVVNGGQSLAVTASNELTDKVEICIYDLDASPRAFRSTNIEIPLYDIDQ